MKKFITALLLTALMCTSVFGQEITFGQNALATPQKIEYQWASDLPGIPPLSGKSSGAHYASSSDNVFAELVFDILFSVWLYDLFVVTWDDYPYADGKYINFLDVETGINAMMDDELPGSQSSVVGVRGKPYRFVLDAGFTSFPEANKYAGEARFEGYIWKFFGPVFEVLSISDDPLSVTSPEDAYINLKLGGQFSLLQSNFLSASFHMQWTHWYGLGETWDCNNGMTLGMILRSYPVKPIVLEWRFNWHDLYSTSYGPERTLFESHLEMGVVLDSPLEIYGAWKYISNENDGKTLNGFAAGIRYHI